MSSTRKYSRVYHDVLDDDRFASVWPDDACLALWVRLLVVADGTWPAPAPVPRKAHRRAMATLVESGLVELYAGGDLYRIHGMTPERIRRSKQAALAADMRWHSISNANSNAPSIPPSSANSNAESMPSSSNRKEKNVLGVNGVSRARPRPEPSMSQISCDSYAEHRSDHQWWPGIGWKCTKCEKVRADMEPSFRERMARYEPKS
jgi:hypothetical protein